MVESGCCLLGWWGKSLEETEEYCKLLLTKQMSSGGTGTPDTKYLKMRAWCSSSCHCIAVKGHLFLALIIL